VGKASNNFFLTLHQLTLVIPNFSSFQTILT
jgi:hypothetical protein